MSQDLDLRRAQPADVASITALIRQASGKWVPLLGREPQPMTADYAEALQRHRIDLLHVDDNLAGLIELVLEAAHLLIENVATGPAWQGRGFGRRLLHMPRLWPPQQAAGSSGSIRTRS